MSGIAGVPHQRAIKALEKCGFRILRQGKHVVMTNGRALITIPRHDPVNAHTLAGIVRDAGLTEAQFRGVL
jgi:predicted RNA binding protein YcfA (HicA-like mRNA interferase family)